MKQTVFSEQAHQGIILDQPPEEVGPGQWTNGQNVFFRDGVTVRAGGYSQYAGTLPDTTPLWGMDVVVGPDVYWMICYSDSVWVTDGVTHWNITPAGGLAVADAGDWTGGSLNGIPVLNNGLNPPMWWDLDVTHRMSTLPGWPANTTCKAIRPHKYHLIAMAITEAGVFYPHMLWWSAGATAGQIPQEWVPTAENDAGDALTADTDGEIIDGGSLRDVFMVYKNWSTYTLQYVAGQYVFSLRKTFESQGIQARNCVAEINGEHWIFSGDDVLRSDGQVFESVVDEKVKRALVGSVESSRIKVCCVAARYGNQQFLVAIPEAGNQWLSKAYIINVKDGAIGIITLPQLASVVKGVVALPSSPTSWDQDGSQWDQDATFWDQQNYNPTDDSLLLLDAANSKLFAAGVSTSADGAPVASLVEKVGLRLGDFTKRKVFTGIVPRIEGQPGDTIMITIGTQAFFDGPIQWGEPQPFVIGQNVAVQSISEGRLLCVKFEGNSVYAWKLHRYSVRWRERGIY